MDGFLHLAPRVPLRRVADVLFAPVKVSSDLHVGSSGGVNSSQESRDKERARDAHLFCVHFVVVVVFLPYSKRRLANSSPPTDVRGNPHGGRRGVVAEPSLTRFLEGISDISVTMTHGGEDGLPPSSKGFIKVTAGVKRGPISTAPSPSRLLQHILFR